MSNHSFILKISQILKQAILHHLSKLPAFTTKIKKQYSTTYTLPSNLNNLPCI